MKLQESLLVTQKILRGFCNIYTEVAKAIHEFSLGNLTQLTTPFYSADGLEGIKFIEKSLESSAANSAWIKF